jgi:polysaccharide deacetylase 2 family uncharacterized protein YibQ
VARGKRPVAQTALLIVAPLVLLGYAGLGGWLWWADQQEPAQTAEHGAVAEPESHSEAESHAETDDGETGNGKGTDDDAKSEGNGPSSEAESQGKTDDPEKADDHGTPAAHENDDGKDHGDEPARANAGHDTGGDTGGDTRHDTGGDARTGIHDDTSSAEQDDGQTDDHGVKPESGHGETADKADHDKPAPEADGHKADTDTQSASDQDKAGASTHNQSAAEPAYKPEPLPASSPLQPAPDPDLTIRGRYGPLPQRADDGREAWQVYGRPFNRRNDSRIIALVITELGLAEQPTLSAIQDLPGEVTLAFTPYSRRLEEWVPAARAAGHEVLLQVPMEPRNIELNDPGDKALLTTNSPEVNLDRLEWVMSRATGYVGLTSFMGSRMTVSEKDMRPVLDAIAARGLAYVDPKVTPVSIAGKLALELGLPAISSDRFIDQQAARDPIDRRLGQLEQIALSRGSAVGFAQAYPVTIERLRKWIPEMKKRGFELAPVSAVVSR